MKRLTLLTLAVLLTSAISFSFGARAQLTGPEPGQRNSEIVPGEVIAIQFQGNSTLSEAELSTVVATKATGGISRALYWTGIFKGLGTYQMLEISTLQRDTAELNLYYRDRGFLLAHSTYRVSPNRDDLHAYNDYIRRERLMKGPPGAKDKAPPPQIQDTVTFIINEGPPFTISRITFEGLESLPNEFQPELTEHVTIKSGNQWSRPLVAKEVERLSGIMVEQGYPNFRFDTIVVEHTEGKTTVNVLLYFTTGHRYRYGSVHIVYDTAVAAKSHVAARVVLAQLYIDSGNWYKLSEIERSEAALYKLGTFDLVRVALDTSYLRTQDSLGDSAAVPIEVYLRMRQRAEVPIGVFAGTTGSQGITIGGNVGFTDRNLSQIADNFNFQLSAQPLPSTQQRYAVNIDYRLPYIGLGRIPLAIGLGASRQFQTVPPDYDQRNISAHVGSSIVLSKLDSRTTLSPDVLLEYLTTITGDSTIHATAPAQQVNLLPSIGYQNDRTNDPINPTGGSLISVSLEYGVPSDLFAMFGDTTPSSAYLRLSPQVKLYYDLSSTGQMILATRLRAGLTKLQDPSDPRRIPSLNHRFFGGGASSNRGWGEQSLIVSNDPHWDASEGGFSDIDGNLEIRFAPWQYTQEFTSWEKLSSPIRFVLFYDIGNVWDNSFYDPWALNFNRFAQTIGLGLRYNLFFGPIRIDCGFKLYDPSGRFSTETHAITQADQGAWLFSHRPLIAIGRTFNWSFAIGQAF